MYSLEIAGSFRGNFKTPKEAMVYVDKHARPFGKPQVIKDRFTLVYAKG